MTDKEWKEVWDFAEKQNVLVKIISFTEDYDKDHFAVGGFTICKNGNILCGYCGEILIENRTAKQIKSIIKNLVEEVEV